MEIVVGPKPSAWATSARAITAPDRMARKMVTRLRASLYVRERVASRLQCSAARICNLAAPLDSRPAGATSVDIWCPSVHAKHARTGLVVRPLNHVSARIDATDLASNPGPCVKDYSAARDRTPIESRRGCRPLWFLIHM